MNYRNNITLISLAAAISSAGAEPPAMMVGQNGYSTTPLVTVGESYDGYRPPGLLDGMFAYDRGDEVYLLVNHEMGPDIGYPYDLEGGPSLSGARISSFVIDKETRTVTTAGLAFDRIFNRAGNEVKEAADLVYGGLNRFCSASGVEAGTYGFVDAIFFAGEETTSGTQWALDVHEGEFWAAPALGVGAWESASPLDIPSINKTHIALLMGDDRPEAPLYLYIGEKDASADAPFLERNGLANGSLYIWKSNDGAISPSEFNGNGTFKKGEFVEVVNTGTAGDPGFDELGYADRANLKAQQEALGAFEFSRPEDIHTNPHNGTQAVFAATGGVTDVLNADGDAHNPADVWGTTYLIDVKISKGLLKTGKIAANLRIMYDGDNGIDIEPPRISFGSHLGLRSPDNLCWSPDHNVYVQEDRASGYHVPGIAGISFPGDIGEMGEESSIWQIHPHSGASLRIAQMNRSVLPGDPFDQQEGDILGIPIGWILGYWESSGIIDVSSHFGKAAGDLFLIDVQAHGTVGDGLTPFDLVEGGQILFLSKD